MHSTLDRARCMVVGCLAAAALMAGGQPAAAQPPHEEQRQGHHSHGRHMESRFNDPERFAQAFDDPARDEWQMPARVIAALDITEGESVADIGAGTGYFTVRLAESTPARTVFAVDIEPAMVDYVRERAAATDLDQIVGILAEPDSPNLAEAVDVVLICRGASRAAIRSPRHWRTPAKRSRCTSRERSTSR